MVKKLDGSLPAVLLSTAELKVVQALASSPDLSSSVREREPDAYRSLEEADLVTESGLDHSIKDMIVGALSAEQSINIVLLHSGQYISTTAFLGRGKDSILTSIGGDEYRLYGADRAETLYQMSEVLSLNAGVAEERIEPRFPKGFVESALTAALDELPGHLAKVQGADDAFMRAVEEGRWLVRIIRHEQLVQGKAELAGIIVAVTVGSRLFLVAVTANEEGHSAVMVNPAALWAEFASWCA